LIGLIWTLKNYWRNQDIVADIPSVLNILRTITSTDEKFLLFLPWEQVGNQLIGYKCACAFSVILNRTLVLPYLGYRHEGVQWKFKFDPTHFSWEPMESYYEFSELSKAPCRIIDMENYRTKVNNSLVTLHFNPITKKANEGELITYYNDTVKFEYTTIIEENRMYQMKDYEVLARFKNNKDQTLALGSMFWTYGFGKKWDYPPKDYVNLMNNDFYRSIVQSMQPKKFYKTQAMAIAKLLRPFAALHYRAGDYQTKCSFKDSATKDKCLIPESKIIDTIIAIKHGGIKNIYISTNAATNDLFFVNTSLHLDVNIYTLPSFYQNFDLSIYDQLGISILEQEICILSGMFYGNIFSSWSRAVMEAIELLNLEYSYF